MQEFISNFHFLRPLWLICLILPLFFYWKYFRGINNKSTWENVCDKKLLNYLLIKGSSAQRRLIAVLSLVGFIGAIMALSGPSWRKQEAPVMTPENPVMIVLNLSSDMTGNDIKPSRLERAKYKIMDMLNGLKSAQTGLIVYTSEPFLISPMTDDAEIIKNLLPVVDFKIMPANGDRPDRAILLAAEKLKAAGYPNGNIVLFTADVGQRFDLALEAAKKAKDMKYAVSVINASAIPNEKLKLISQYGDGMYEKITYNDSDIQNLDNFINKSISELKKSENKQSTWIDEGYYLTIIPFLCCLYFFRKGILVIIALLAFSAQAQAGFFLNNNQEAYKSFSAGDYPSAAKKFEDNNWKASSLYREGNFDEAYKNFAKGKDVTSLYNQGNALAKGGKIKEAIAKYEEVLKLEAEHEDAKFNLEYLKKQEQEQEQQNQEQQQQQSQQDKSQSDENKTQNNEGNDNSAQNQQSPENKPQQEQPDNQNPNDKQQPQSSENNRPPEENNQKQNGEEQNQQGEEQDKKDEEQESKPTAAEMQEGDKDNEYDEETQARTQQYREIPEDPGGLVRAFIAKEYRLNRYGDD